MEANDATIAVESRPRGEELIGEFSHVQTSKGADNSDERWAVNKLRDNKTVVGCCRKDALQRGQTYRFLGNWRQDDRFGRQFHFNSVRPAEPLSLDGIERYIAKRLKGIGPQKAKQIVGEYGKDALDRLRDSAVQIGMKFGISDEDMIHNQQFLTANKRLERITVELEQLLSGRGFPRKTPQKCIEAWGVNACDAIKENPFVLRRFPGIGFLKCDALWERLGLPMDSLTRQTYCVLYALESDAVGHTWLPEKTIRDELRKKIAGAKVQLQDAIGEAKKLDLIRERDGWYAEATKADAESSYVSDLVVATKEGVGEDGF